MEIKWIKLSTDIFNNRKIRQLEQMPDGDALIVIWLKLLTLAGNVNDGGLIYFTHDIPYTEQLLATQFNKSPALIQLALSTFEKFEMIEIIDDMIHVSNWEKYQNVEEMEKIREQNRLRKQKQREREKQALLEDKNIVSRDSHVTSQQSHATDIDIDIDIDIEKEYKKSLQTSLSTGVDLPSAKEVVTLYHSICKSYPRVRSISDSREKAIKARLRTHGLEQVKEVFQKAEMSEFLKGNNNRNWSATFDWLMKDSNFCKVLDGNYNSCNETPADPTEQAGKEIRYTDEQLDILFNGGKI